MKRCSKEAWARCPDREGCEPYAEFTDGCECDRFNEKIMQELDGRPVAPLADSADRVDPRWRSEAPDRLRAGAGLHGRRRAVSTGARKLHRERAVLLPGAV